MTSRIIPDPVPESYSSKGFDEIEADPTPDRGAYLGWDGAEEMDRALWEAACRVRECGLQPQDDAPLSPRARAWWDELLTFLYGPPDFLTNYACKRKAQKEGRKEGYRVGRPAGVIAADLFSLTGGWPCRVGGQLFDVGPDYKPRWLTTTDDLFAWIGAQAPRVAWSKGEDCVTRGVFHAHLRQAAEAYDAIESLPHWPPMPGRLYLHPKPGGGDGRALKGLLDRFCPATDLDRSLILAAFLTPFWGGEPGARPLFLVTCGDDDGEGGRGTGKSTLAKAVGRLVEGHFDARPGEEMGRLLNRLLSPDASCRRVALLDNVKTLKFSWADLEGLITSDQINGYRLYVGDSSRPNTMTWFITLNGASLSKDLAQRSVMIRLGRPDYSGTWEAETWAYIDERRWAIVGDLLSLLSGGKSGGLERYSRWATWEREVLECVPSAPECQALIRERQATIDDDQADSDLVRDAFAAKVRFYKGDPETAVVFFPSKTAAEIVNEATGERRATNKAISFLNTLAIPELRKSNATGARGLRWTGPRSAPGQTAVRLEELASEALKAIGAGLKRGNGSNGSSSGTSNGSGSS